MAVPRLPAFDAKTFSERLHERVVSSVGRRYVVFDPIDDNGNLIGFPRFIEALRGQRDIVARHEVQLTDQKRDLDRLAVELDSAEERIAALEAQQPAPFPGSG